MRIILRTAGLALALLANSYAQDAIFLDSALVVGSGAKTTPVDLIVTNQGVTIRSKPNAPPVLLDFPYSSISSLGYTYGERGRLWLAPIMGVSALFIKSQSHWLVIETTADGVKKPTV